MTKIGVVVVDDFHRLSEEAKQQLTDYVKTLADEEDIDSKLVLIGINRAGQSLVDYAPDLLHRAETIRVGRTNIERLRELIELGEKALGCKISVAEELAAEAEGSFAMAQVLCHEACVQGKVFERHSGTNVIPIDVSLPTIREAVLQELAPRFFPPARDFATGNRLRREGRAPYLHLLRWLSETPEGALDTKEAIAALPALKGSVAQVIEKGHLSTLIEENSAVHELIHFDKQTGLLTTEDPKFLYFTRHLIWSKFARQVGYFSIEFKSQYDYALSFAGEEREVAEMLFRALQEREISVFYDKNEQHRILANDVEQYLAPIYRSEARFVVPLLSKNYPKKIWAKFESDNFKDRFGENSVIPIWFSDSLPGMFDETKKIGGQTFDVSGDWALQVSGLVNVFAKQLEEVRQTEARATVAGEAYGENASRSESSKQSSSILLRNGHPSD